MEKRSVAGKVRDRVERAVEELVQKHLDLLILLLAAQGVPQETQRSRTDMLVRCLTGCQIEDTIFKDGRRIPLSLDTTTNPPTLRLNGELLARVSDDDIFATFTRPVSTILQLAPISVGLVLQGRDEKQLRDLYHTGRHQLETQPIRATSVRSVIERRVVAFAERVRKLVYVLSEGKQLQFSQAASFIGWLESLGGQWPEWIDVQLEDFAHHAINLSTDALADKPWLPPAPMLLELCWESLNLSPPSFMRHVAREMRTKEIPVSEDFLLSIARVVAPGKEEEIAAIDQWPSLHELQTAWENLYTLEVATLGRHHQGGDKIPRISVFQAPRDSLGLREPEDLPFDYPLASWSVRETNALRDLLQGFVQTHKNSRRQSETEDELILVDIPDFDDEAILDTSEPSREYKVEVVGTTLTPAAGYEELQQRAVNAALRHLQHQMLKYDDGGQLNVLHRIRGSYDGFFMNTRTVWERRLQGWQLDTRAKALVRLGSAVGDLLERPVIFDPFESPESHQIRPMPTFCFIVAVSPHLERVPLNIPISTINMTSAMGTPPLRVRLIEVPGDASEPCKWRGDHEVTMNTMQGQPVQLTLNAIEDDTIRWLVLR
jgi:hypothetical protein